MPINLLSDVDVVAISLVDKAANRKRFYLRKQEDVLGDVIDLPAPHNLLLKGNDWSVVYSVVAEPGWKENAGSGSPGETVEDQWASADEIRRASHKFMKNGALVNRMHETLEPYGTLVENFVAQADITVGEEVIKAGSWVIGIEPTDEGRARIESGEFTGVSIQGTGLRTLQKTPGPPGTDISRNQGKQFGPLKNLIAFYMKKKHPFTACVRDNRKRFGPRAENVCAALKDIALQSTDWRNGNKNMNVAKAADVPEEMYGEAIVIWKRHGLSEEDASLAWEGIVEDQDRNLLTKIADKLGISKDEAGSEGEETGTVESVEITKEQFDELKASQTSTAEAVEKSGKAVEQLANRVADIAEALANKSKDEEQTNPAEEVYHRLDEVSKSLGDIRTDVETLAKGQSRQPETGEVKEQVAKGDDDWKKDLF